MRTLLFKRQFTLMLNAEGEIQTKEFELPSDVKSVVGYSLTSRRKDLLWYRTSVGLYVAGEELITDGMDAAEYMFGHNHPARTFAFGELPIGSTNRQVRLRAKDEAVAGFAFSPYAVKLVLTCTKTAN